MFDTTFCCSYNWPVCGLSDDVTITIDDRNLTRNAHKNHSLLSYICLSVLTLFIPFDVCSYIIRQSRAINNAYVRVTVTFVQLRYRSVPLQTRTNALECLNRLVDSLDKMMILEELLPFLTEIQCSDVDIIMAVVCTCVRHCVYLANPEGFAKLSSANEVHGSIKESVDTEL